MRVHEFQSFHVAKKGRFYIGKIDTALASDNAARRHELHHTIKR